MGGGRQTAPQGLQVCLRVSSQAFGQYRGSGCPDSVAVIATRRCHDLVECRVRAEDEDITRLSGQRRTGASGAGDDGEGLLRNAEEILQVVSALVTEGRAGSNDAQLRGIWRQSQSQHEVAKNHAYFGARRAPIEVQLVDHKGESMGRVGL